MDDVDENMSSKFKKNELIGILYQQFYSKSVNNKIEFKEVNGESSMIDIKILNPNLRIKLFTKAERLISYRNLKPNRKEGFLKLISIFSFLGIMLGVAILIIVIGCHEWF